MACIPRSVLHKIADEMLITGRMPDSPSRFNRTESPQAATETSDPCNPEKQLRSLGSSVPEIANSVIEFAIMAGSSDIHIEPSRTCTKIRLRIDGQLQEVTEIASIMSPEFISRLKILCNMDIAEKRRPQDGRFRFSRGRKSVDIRVSTIPTESGEKMVLRLLDQSGSSVDLEQLGIPVESRRLLQSALDKPQGMILVTGPTGSGKTTTLYACLRQIRNPNLNILTIEDPIEYRLEGINQSQVKQDIGYDFAKALRAFLRQDPNVIMVGEIRDAETAQIALRAAMTGHLVLSTVHTNDAATTVTRLLDLGAEPYLVASSLSLIIAQRLVRLLCKDCRQPADGGDSRYFRSVGCPACNNTGYRGRIGVFEVLPVDPAIQEMIHARTPCERIRDKAKSNGMSVLAEAGKEKWLQGLTTREEVEREIGSIESL